MTGIAFTQYNLCDLPCKSEDHQGYVYFLGHKNMTKIGFTSNPKARMCQIIALNKIDNEIIWLSQEHETFCTNEKRIHSLYRKQRVVGEWFSVDANLISKEYPDYFLTHLERNIDYEKSMKRIYAQIYYEKRKLKITECETEYKKVKS